MPSTIAPEANLAAILKASERLSLGRQELADILGVDQSTLYRWRQGASSPRGLARARLTQVEELFELLRRLFAGPDLARAWLREAKPESLGGWVTPLEMLKANRIDRVLALLNALAAGG